MKTKPEHDKTKNLHSGHEEIKGEKMSAYKNAVCRGSVSLGTACGVCERCLENKISSPDFSDDPIQTDSERINELSDRIVELQKSCKLRGDLINLTNEQLEESVSKTDRAIQLAKKWKGKSVDAHGIVLAIESCVDPSRIQGLVKKLREVLEE